jgi:phosphoglycolate phosphatase
LPHSSHRLVLFDIDGTLLYGGPLWAESFRESLREVIPGHELPPVSFHGKTDGLICREVFEALGIAGEHSPLRDPRFGRVIEGYLRRVRNELAERAHEMTVLPGVVRLLEALRDTPGIELGLLTGNVVQGAELKLQASGLIPHFKNFIGAFGDDHWIRSELPAIAVKKARDRLGREYRGKEIVIIGDTVHDVRCGQGVGARSIAVGTGHVDQVELRAEGADFYFEDLAETQAVVEAVVEALRAPL